MFSVKCFFSHANFDDPILHPDEPGEAHKHHFYGNKSTDAYTTTRRLERRSTNCDRPEDDKAAYWSPALFDGTTELFAYETHFYYRNINVMASERDQHVPFPRGFRMIAGTAEQRIDVPPGERVANWECQHNPTPTDDFPDTCEGKDLFALITFPSCWDGINLTPPENPEDQSHVVYPWRNPENPRVCPDTHPVVLPELTQHIRYEVPLVLAGLSLSSGDGDSLHADFWNAWDEPTQAFLVENCLLAGIQCGTIGGVDPPGAP